MSGELNPTLGDIRPHGHLKLGRFTQHFVDVLDLSQTPLEFFEKMYPTDTYDEQRKYLGRFGVSGKMQMRKMEELSDGQKSRVVLAKLGRDVPHIVSTILYWTGLYWWYHLVYLLLVKVGRIRYTHHWTRILYIFLFLVLVIVGRTDQSLGYGRY
jgi:hypothetical protein